VDRLLTTEQAMKISGMSARTLRKAAREHGIGFKLPPHSIQLRDARSLAEIKMVLGQALRRVGVRIEAAEYMHEAQEALWEEIHNALGPCALRILIEIAGR
jgi:hypothetical protein